MLKFSASVDSNYKNYAPMKCEMAEMGHFLRRSYVSSFMYKDGEIVRGGVVVERPEKHRRIENIVRAGTVLLVDIDSKYVAVTGAQVYEKLRGVSCYIAPSKNWSEAVQKFHIAIEVDEPLPKDRTEFKRVYRAVMQQLDLSGWYDPAMESPSQMLAPHERVDAPEWHVEGEAVCLAEALAAYAEAEGEAEEAGAGIAGEVGEGQVFYVTAVGRSMTVGEVADYVEKFGKVRVDCIHEPDHKDAAFINEMPTGGLLYHCKGGRCGLNYIVPVNPFEGEDEGDGELVVERVVLDESVEGRVARARDIIMDNRHIAVCYDDKATVVMKEAAVAYAAQTILEGAGVREVNGDLMIFNGRYWETMFAHGSDMYSLVQELCRSAGFHSMAYSDSKTNAIRSMIEKTTPPEKLTFKGNYLNLVNCVLEVSTRGIRTLPHDRGYVFTSVLPYAYDKGAKAPVWTALVEKIMCKRADLVESFKQSMGYLLLRDMNIEIMVGFVGEGSNGKTTVMNVLKRLLGRDAYSAVPIKMLVKDSSEGQYSRAQISGKLLNLTNELTPASLEADAFKDLITGEDIQARNPYGKPFTMETVPKQLVAMNKTDHLIKERTHGFMPRLQLIPFDYTVTAADRDRELYAKLYAELPGILNWCLEGAQAVLENGRIAPSRASKELFDTVERNANPAQQFLEECFVLDDGAVTSNDELYTAFASYCDENGYRRWGKTTFMKECDRLGVVRIDKRVRVAGQKTPKAIRGFSGKLRSEMTPDNVIMFKKAR